MYVYHLNMFFVLVLVLHCCLSLTAAAALSADTAEDLEAIAENYKIHSIPLDVLVSDMAWHYHGGKQETLHHSDDRS